jgi:heme/copper-type cytochrome/quinol oxidase subunit 2
MRLIILTLCGLVAVGVFATMFLSIWSSRRGGAPQRSARQHVAAELVWAAIPCLMIVAAAIPAVIAIATSSPGDSRAVSGNSLDAEPLKPERSTSAPSRLLADPLEARTRRGAS